MTFLTIQNLSKSYQHDKVLQDISFTLEEGQTLAVLGRSGCGKTTLLKMIAGLASGEGSVHLAGQDIVALPPQQRSAVYIYQEPLLFPHLNVFENVAFGLRIRKIAGPEIQTRVSQMIGQLGLTDHTLKMPNELSGGQKQRVAFGRALIIQPRLLLLDEPFGALDATTRTDMQRLFKQMAVDNGITAIFVTHDVKEAILMGDCMAYMEKGNLDIYPDKAAFIADERTGIPQEIIFWKNISTHEF